MPYWTHDIGGFFSKGSNGEYPNGIEDPAFQELYTRWFQFGAFSPIFRSHGTDHAKRGLAVQRAKSGVLPGTFEDTAPQVPIDALHLLSGLVCNG